MTIPTDITLRPGYDRRFLNIDVAGKELGHLRLADDGHVVDRWANFLEDRPLVLFVERCYTAALHQASARAAS